MKKYFPDRYLWILLIISFLLRLPGLFDGLPAVYNSTEYFLSKIALNYGAQKTLDPGVYIYPTFYSYLLFLLYAVYLLAGLILGAFSSAFDFAVQFLTNPAGFYLIARSFNLLMSLASVAIIYHFLAQYLGQRQARLGATLTAFSFYLVLYSNFATADTLLLFFSTLTTIWFYKIFRSSRKNDVFLAGVFAGLAVAAKYNAGFLVAGLFVLVIQQAREKKIPYFDSFPRAVTGVGMGFLLPNPYLLIYPQRFFDGLQLMSSQMYNAVSAERGTMFVWEIFALATDELSLGLLFIAATIYFLIRTGKEHWPALSVIILTYLFVGSWSKKGIDYLFAAYPAWILLSTFFLNDIIEKLKNRLPVRNLLLTMIFLPVILGTVYHSICSFNKDTREIATEWLIGQTESGTSVCYDNYHIDLGVFDVERYINYGDGADRLPEKIKQLLEGKRSDKRQVAFVPIMVPNPDASVREGNRFESEESRFRRLNLSELHKKGVRFLITNSWYYESYLHARTADYSPGIQQRIIEVQTMYQQLANDYQPVMMIKPGFWTPGPEINIYDLMQQRRSVN